MKKWFTVMLIIGGLVFGSVIGFNLFVNQKISDFIANMPEPEFPVTAMIIKPQTWQSNLHAIGYVEPNQGGMLSNQVSGIVSKINFKNGTKVKKNQLLIALNTDVEKADLKQRVVQLPATKAEYERTKTLYKSKSASKQRLDESQSRYLALDASITSLKATIGRREIRAPFDGIVGLREVNLGQYIQVGSDVVRIENLNDMKIRFTIPQTQLPLISKGQAVKIYVDAYPNEPFAGSISAIEPAVFDQSGLVQIQANIPNTENKLRSGMFAEADILLPELKQQIVLPRSAMTYTLYGDSIYVIETLTENGKEVQRVSQRVVKIIERSDGQALISGDVKAGDKVVTSGQIRLSNKSKVKIAESNALVPPSTMSQL
jgi:membrane fusion protein (multidrug efflux system)